MTSTVPPQTSTVTEKQSVSKLDVERPLVMGVLNLTPDSFFDGGRYQTLDQIKTHIERMVKSGVDIIDVGGESTRPNSKPISVEQELERVMPVIEMLREEFDVPVSVDTSKPQVMNEAVAQGVVMINDVYALQNPGAIEAMQACDVQVCLMHMQGEPGTMQENPQYDDVVSDVVAWLNQRIEVCSQAGIGKERLLVDPGFGFGKKPEHNLTLTRELDALHQIGCPIVYGASRKGTIGHILGHDAEKRLAGSLALAVVAAINGASMIRTHDVEETLDALRILEAMQLLPGEEYSE